MHVVIIGSGHAGITAANTLRQNADDISISMITDDHYPHYPRPSIYKVILGKEPSRMPGIGGIKGFEPVVIRSLS